MNFKHDICRITISCFLISKITMKNIFFNKLKSIFTFKTNKNILNGCAGDILIEEETTDYPIQSSKTGFDNYETITLDNIVNYLSNLPIWKKYNHKHRVKSTIGMADLSIKPKQVKKLLNYNTKCNDDSTKMNKQFIKVNQDTTVDVYQSESSKQQDTFNHEDDNSTQSKQDHSVPLINDVLDLAKQEQKENILNPISANLINTVEATDTISKNDNTQSTDSSVVLPTTVDGAITSVIEINQYEHVLQEFTQRIAKIAEMAKDTIVPLTFDHPFFEISYEKNPHFHFQDIQEISDSGLYELQETKELVRFPLFFYPVFTHESTGQVELNQTQETNGIYENHVVATDHVVNVIQTTHEVNIVKKIKFLLEDDLDKDDYLESCLGGQIGLIYVDKEIIRQKYKVKRITKKIHDELVDEAKKLIKQLNQQ